MFAIIINKDHHRTGSQPPLREIVLVSRQLQAPHTCELVSEVKRHLDLQSHSSEEHLLTSRLLRARSFDEPLVQREKAPVHLYQCHWIGTEEAYIRYPSQEGSSSETAKSWQLSLECEQKSTHKLFLNWNASIYNRQMIRQMVQWTLVPWNLWTRIRHYICSWSR